MERGTYRLKEIIGTSFSLKKVFVAFFRPQIYMAKKLKKKGSTLSVVMNSKLKPQLNNHYTQNG